MIVDWTIAVVNRLPFSPVHENSLAMIHSDVMMGYKSQKYIYKHTHMDTGT